MNKVKRFVLVHPERGIYLGSFMGLGIWTGIDTAGQPAACTFASPEEAQEFVHSWDEAPKVATVAVEVNEGTSFASIADCVAAGLEAWNPKA